MPDRRILISQRLINHKKKTTIYIYIVYRLRQRRKKTSGERKSTVIYVRALNKENII